MLRKEKTTQKCPRCGEKAFITEKKCDNCGLVFEKLRYASNKEAKKCMLRGEKEKIVKTTTFPNDRNKWLAATLCAFLGFVGAHNFYLGRYIKAFFSAGMIMLSTILILVLEPTLQAYIYSTWLVIPSALVLFFWFYDLILILINKYKIPIALDMPALTEKKYEKSKSINKDLNDSDENSLNESTHKKK